MTISFFKSCFKVCFFFSSSDLTDYVEVEMMKERFSKLLLGEDMSGSGNGVCTALAISNAITNLCGMWNYSHGLLNFTH